MAKLKAYNELTEEWEIVADIGATGPRGATGPAGSGGGDSLWLNDGGTLTSVDALPLELKESFNLNDFALFMRNLGDLNHSIRWGYTRHGIDGPVINGFANVGIATGDANSNGDILVATFSPNGGYIWDNNTSTMQKIVLDNDPRLGGLLESGFQTVGMSFYVEGVNATFPLELDGVARSVSISASSTVEVSLRNMESEDIGQRWHIYAASNDLIIIGLADGDVTVPAQYGAVIIGADIFGSTYWSIAEVFPISPTVGAGGATGPEGPTGPQGEIGATGPSGVDGATGPSGVAGASGPTGATGPAGASGVQGPSGPQGVQGASGAVGSTGAQGFTGPKGDLPIVVQDDAPVDTDVIWIDEDEEYLDLASIKGWVNHGATASTARPLGFGSVEWYGTVIPDNWITGDTLIDPTGELEP